MRLVNINLVKLPPPSLTASQWRSLAAGAVTVLTAGYNYYTSQIAPTHPNLPAWATSLIAIVGAFVMMRGRSLDRSRSGTGSGVVGTPGDAAAGAVIVAENVAGGAFGVLPPPNLLPTITSALTLPNLLALIAYAGTLVTSQHSAAAIEMTEQMDSQKLLAGIAAVSDAAKDKTPPAGQNTNAPAGQDANAPAGLNDTNAPAAPLSAAPTQLQGVFSVAAAGAYPGLTQDTPTGGLPQ